MRLLLILFCLQLAVAKLVAQRGRQPQKPITEQNDDPAFYGIKSKQAVKLYIEGMLQQGYGRYREAIPYFDAALREAPVFGMAHFRRGECVFLDKAQFGGKLSDALPSFKSADSIHANGRPDMQELYFYLGEIYFFEQDYQKSEAYLKRYLNSPKPSPNYRERAQRRLPQLAFCVEAVKHPVSFEPENLGKAINTPDNEYLPCLTADDGMLFFTSRRNGATGGFNPYSNDYAEDFYYAHRLDGAWQPAQNLGPPINTQGNEGAVCISPDGQYVFFAACYRPDGQGNCDLYVAKLDGIKWGTPENLGSVVNGPDWDSQPNLSNDGKTLFFVSGRAGGYGGSDIWVTTYENDRWTAPKNLGPSINSSGNEYGPFLHADDVTFYFSSDGHMGFGEQDLFMTTITDSGWAKPRNLGYPLNSPGTEASIFVNTAGTRAYFNADRPGGLGKTDIYGFELDPAIQPRRATFVRGLVLDSLTGKPLGAAVELLNLATGQATRDVESNSATGQFLLSLPLEQDYAAFVKASGYLFYSQNFSLKGITGTPFYDLTIKLQPIQAGATVVLRNIFFAYNSAELLPESRAELQKVLDFLLQNPTVAIELAGHTDSQGTDAYNLTLSQQRAESVRNYLITKNIGADKLLAKGYGKTKPIATNDTDTGRAENRRTEFIIRSK